MFSLKEAWPVGLTKGPEEPGTSPKAGRPRHRAQGCGRSAQARSPHVSATWIGIFCLARCSPSSADVASLNIPKERFMCAGRSTATRVVHGRGLPPSLEHLAGFPLAAWRNLRQEACEKGKRAFCLCALQNMLRNTSVRTNPIEPCVASLGSVASAESRTGGCPWCQILHQPGGRAKAGNRGTFQARATSTGPPTQACDGTVWGMIGRPLHRAPTGRPRQAPGAGRSRHPHFSPRPRQLAARDGLGLLRGEAVKGAHGG